MNSRCPAAARGGLVSPRIPTPGHPRQETFQMKNRIATATAAAIATIAMMATCATHAQTVEPRDTWNLAEIYPSLQAWNADQDKLTAQLAELGKCAGQMGTSAARFRQCMDLSTDMDKRISRMYAYASEKFSDDTSLPANLELNQRAEL